MLKEVMNFIDEVSSEGQRIDNNLREAKNQYNRKNSNYLNL